MTMKAIIVSCLLISSSILLAQQIKRTENVHIKFTSEAPLELITASSESCIGILDIDNSEFAFRVRLRSFEGFNSPLQREHFNENYMQSDLHPNATFEGRFVEEIDLTVPDRYSVKVKGSLNIHNTEDERVLNVTLLVSDDGIISFESDFEVELETHKISVPRIVYQKISEVISISVKGEFQ